MGLGLTGANMRGLSLACFALCAGLAFSQETTESSQGEVTTEAPAPPTTRAPAPPAITTEHPTVILKQINEINEDGTYTVGYEATDGTFKLETRDEEGNVEGKYGYLNEEGEIVIVEYSANNSTGFTSDADAGVAPSAIAGAAPVPVTPSPEFALEKQRHEAVLAHQARVIERQNAIARQRDDSQQRRQFAAQRGQQGRPQRPVFNAAQFNPNQPAAQQFNNQNFNQDFQQFQQQQQQQQFAPQQPQRPAFESQFQDFQNRRQQQQFAPQQRQQFSPQQQFAPEQPRAPLVPVSQLTRE